MATGSSSSSGGAPLLPTGDGDTDGGDGDGDGEGLWIGLGNDGYSTHHQLPVVVELNMGSFLARFFRCKSASFVDQIDEASSAMVQRYGP